MANGGIRQVAATIEETGLLGDLGLPEIDEIIPTPAAVFKKLGIPTLGDLLKGVRSSFTGEGQAPFPLPPPFPLPFLPGQARR